MFIEYRAVLPLRIFLVLLFGLLVLLQTMSFPGQFAHMAEVSPERAHLRWPLTALAVFLLLCAEVVVVATWKLLSLVKSDRIFSPSSLVWVDAIVYAIAAGWLVVTGIWLWVGFTADDPGVPLLLGVVVIGLTVFGLLVVVLRALLRQATALRTDMDSVI